MDTRTMLHVLLVVATRGPGTERYELIAFDLPGIELYCTIAEMIS